MKTTLWAGLAMFLALAGGAAAQLAPGTVIKAKLSIEIESANAQVGDQVSAVSTAGLKQGKLSLPKGTVFNGHVTAVTPSSDGGPGSVAVLFDQAVTPKGETLPIKAGVASAKMPSASGAASPYSRGRSRRGGFGYPRQEPPSTPVAQATPLEIRFPANAAVSGSVLSKTAGDVWVNPQTQVTLQIIAPAAPSQ